MPKKRSKNFKANQRQKQLKANSNSPIGRGGNRTSLFGYNLTGGYHNSNTNVDYWDAAGYPKQLNFGDLWNMQARFGIAKSGIHKIVNKCWQSPPIITDGDFDGEREKTKFEKDIEILIEKHHLFSRFKGVDWRQRVGRYGALFPIIKEQSPGKTDEELTRINGIQALVKIVPKFESEIDVTDVGTITDITSVDYGMPKFYNLREDVNGDRNPIDNQQIRLHPSRVFIVAEGADDGSIFGTPANEAGFNALMDLEIICASGQTGLRKNAKQRFIASVKDGQVANALKDPKLKKEYDENIDKFNRQDSPSLTVFGMDITALQSTLADPTNPFTISLNVYAASIETPASEIIGVQMNKQASVGNETAFNETATSRRENFLTPSITGFLNYLIDHGVISEPTNKIKIEWTDLQEDSPTEKLERVVKMATVNKENFNAGGKEQVFTNDEMRIEAGHEAEPEGELLTFGEDDIDDKTKET